MLLERMHNYLSSVLKPPYLISEFYRQGSLTAYPISDASASLQEITERYN